MEILQAGGRRQEFSDMDYDKRLARFSLAVIDGLVPGVKVMVILDLEYDLGAGWNFFQDIRTGKYIFIEFKT